MRMNESLLQKCTRHYKMQDYARLYCIRNANACDFDIFDSWPFPTQHSWPRRVQATQVPVDMGNGRIWQAYLNWWHLMAHLAHLAHGDSRVLFRFESHDSQQPNSRQRLNFRNFLKWSLPNLGMESSESQDSTSAKAQHTQTAHIRVSCIKQEPAWASWQFPWLVNLDKLLFAILQGIHFRTTPWISVRPQQVNGMSLVLEFWSTMFQFGMGDTVTY